MNRQPLKKRRDTLRKLRPCAADEARTDKPAVAVEHLPAGDDGERIRDHLDHETAGDEPEEEIARDFLDRRDEARISHRLARPFTF